MVKKSIMNVNMVKQNLSRTLLENNYTLTTDELSFLSRYYESNINRVESLILDGEYVGQSYNNLMTIKGLMKNEEKPKVLRKVI